MSYIDNHVTLGLNRLLEQHKNKLKIGGFLTSLLSRYQLLENSLNDIDKKARLQTATGAVLDRIGVNFNITRNQLSDNWYRQKIYISILVNRSKGNILGISTAINLLYKPQALSIVEYNCLVQINMLLPSNINNLARILPAIIVAGVRYSAVYETANCGTLGSSTIAKVDFDVDKEEDLFLLLTDEDKKIQVMNSVTKMPKNIFKLGMRFDSGGFPELIKGSDLAIRLI